MGRFSSYEEHIVGSTVAGVGSTILGHPLDSIKTHLQTNPKLQNSFHVIREVKLGIFRGMAPPLISAIAMNTVMFSVFDQVNEQVGDPFIAGILSGFATAMISTPMDYVKIHAQLSGRQSWSIVRATSPFMLYRGHVANLGREGLFTMVYLGLYHSWTVSGREEKNLLSVAVTSSMTGALAWIVSYPLDTTKTLIQSGRSMNAVASLLQKNGLSSFYKGCGASTGRAMLVTSSRMIAYEWILSVMRED
jgi:solute carrier family 25 carnitine/acylcarnitine transporter 20/29